MSRRDWKRIGDVALRAEQHHPDFVHAVEAVREVLRSRPLAYLEPTSVSVDADPAIRGACIRFQHLNEPDVVVELCQGDGYTVVRSPLGSYGGYIPDGEFQAFVDSLLTGGLIVQNHRLHWPSPDGRSRVLSRGSPLARALRRLLSRERDRGGRSLSFDRAVAIAATHDI